MKTEPLYLTDPYLKEMNATVVEVVPEGEEQFRIILDQTVFYPMGGGQPTDQGHLIFENGISLEVFQVMLKDGEIWHYVKSKYEPVLNSKVKGTIDWDRRLKHMQIHTGGHILDFAMYLLGYSPDKLKPYKGDHGKKPYVQYLGKLETIGKSEVELQNELQNKINELISKNLSFTWEFKPLEELQKEAIYLQPGLPTNKPLRMLKLDTVGAVADGGTILKSTSEVGGIEITKVEEITEYTVVHYQISASSASTATQVTSVESNTSIKTGNISNQSLKQLLDTATTEANGLNSEADLTELWRKYLGKEGILKDAMTKIVEIPAEERKTYGQEVNNIKDQIDRLINTKKKEINSGKTSEYLQKEQGNLGYSKPKVGHLHPLTETANELNEIFKRLGYSVFDGPELETDEYLFQRCNVPLDHPARDLQDSIFIEEPNILLRTQTSSVEAHALQDMEPPFKIVIPGRVYRNEKVNRSNHFTFHQYQLVCVQEKVSLSELLSTIDYLFKSYLGNDVVTRFRNKYYPEVEPGVGPDLQCWMCHGVGCTFCKGRGWVEMGGAGIIHPNMMKMAGLDTDKWQGYAFGLGLDRWAMAKHGIVDIRTLLGGNLAYKPHVR